MKQVLFLLAALLVAGSAVAYALDLKAFSDPVAGQPDALQQAAGDDAIPDSTLSVFRRSCVQSASANGLATAGSYCGCLTEAVAETYTLQEFTAFERSIAQGAQEGGQEGAIQAGLNSQKFQGLVRHCLTQAQ